MLVQRRVAKDHSTNVATLTEGSLRVEQRRSPLQNTKGGIGGLLTSSESRH